MPIFSTKVIVFDVNGTLFDLGAFRPCFEAFGSSPELAAQWFASILRDGFALSLTDSPEQFLEVARGCARSMLSGTVSDTQLELAVEQVISTFDALALHPDVADAIRALRGSGYRLGALTNGSADATRRLLACGGILEQFEQVLSADEVGAWKPAFAPYDHAARSFGLDRSELLLVAAHPWDVHGAKCAGLRAAWVDRSGTAFPGHFLDPDVVARDFTRLADVLAK